MADDKNKAAAGAAAELGAAAQPSFTLDRLLQFRQMFGSDADAARAQQVDGIRRQHAADDAQREAQGTVRVVALTSFTLMGVDGEGATRQRVVRAGQEFDLPRFDLDGYDGKVRLKSLDAEDEGEAGGVTISQG